MLNDNALYSRGDDNIRGDPPPVGSAVVSFFKACADNLAKTQQELFFKEFLTAVAHLGLHQVPLFFIAQVCFYIQMSFFIVKVCDVLFKIMSGEMY